MERCEGPCAEALTEFVHGVMAGYRQGLTPVHFSAQPEIPVLWSFVTEPTLHAHTAHPTKCARVELKRGLVQGSGYRSINVHVGTD